MRKTKRTEITVETYRRRVLVHRSSGQPPRDSPGAGGGERARGSGVRSRKERRAMNTTTPQILLVMTFCALGSWKAASAQVAPPTILQVDVENQVSYVEDTTDVTKFATLPNVTPAAVLKNFFTSVLIGDIVAVNGQPAKRTIVFHLRQVVLTPMPKPVD